MRRMDGVHPATRAFLYAFLFAFVLCGSAAIEAWPLTGWRLFSHARAQQQAGWTAVGVDASDREAPLGFSRFGVAYNGHPQLLARFPTMSAGERARICRAWVERARALGADIDHVRVYRTLADRGARAGDRGLPPQRSLAYSCGG